MQIITSICVKILTWLLEYGGRYIYEKINDYVEKQRQEAIEKENLKRYKDNEKKEVSDDQTLQDETDIINGTRSK